jgi:solute:Na+ symporter, SSS family
MTAIPVSISLVAADMIAISYMGAPAWTYQHNLELVWSSWSYLFVAPVVMFLFMPFYSFKFYTAYEYLERRFDLKTRLLGKRDFSAHAGLACGHRYLRAIADFVPHHRTPPGRLRSHDGRVHYSVHNPRWHEGGYLDGCHAIFDSHYWLVHRELVVDLARARRYSDGLAGCQRCRAPASLQFFDRSHGIDHVLGPPGIGGAFMALSTLGTDQAYLQRYFTTRSLKEGQRSILLDAIIVVPVSLLLYSVGPVLYTFYHFNPDKLKGLPATDAILPFFVMTQLGG